MIRFLSIFKSVDSANCTRLFLLLIPFAYATQVVSGIREIAVVAFLPLLAGVVTYAIRERTSYFRAGIPLTRDWLAFGMAFLALHNGVSTLATFSNGNYGLGFRSFFLFVLPFGIYAIAYAARAQAKLQFITIVAMTSLIVALEMLYENISARIYHSPTWFQLLNKDYVFAVNGRSLSQLYLPAYRPTGLLEHVHATVLYVCLGTIASLVLYVRSGRVQYLLVLLVSFMAVLQHGVRIPLAGLFLTLGAAGFFIRSNLTLLQKRNLVVAAIALSCVAVICLVADPLGVARQYYWPVLMRGDFQTTDPLDVTFSRSLGMISNSSDWGRFLLGSRDVNFFNVFFGLGIASSFEPVHSNSDDLFVLQLLSQYGFVGAAIFFGTFYLAIQRARAGLRSGGEMERFLAVFSVCVLILLGVSSLHSGAMQRKAIYPVFMLALGLAASGVPRGAGVGGSSPGRGEARQLSGQGRLQAQANCGAVGGNRATT